MYLLHIKEKCCQSFDGYAFIPSCFVRVSCVLHYTAVLLFILLPSLLPGTQHFSSEAHVRYNMKLWTS